MFIPQAQPHAQSLFLLPIVFGINLIHFFDEKKQNEECELFRRVQRFWQRKVWTQRHSRGGKEVHLNIWQGKVQNSSPILRCTFLSRKSAKLIANFSTTKVTSLPSVSLFLSLSLSLSLSLYLSLSLSLSLSPSAPHAQYRKRFGASYINPDHSVIGRSWCWTKILFVRFTSGATWWPHNMIGRELIYDVEWLPIRKTFFSFHTPMPYHNLFWLLKYSEKKPLPRHSCSKIWIILDLAS